LNLGTAKQGAGSLAASLTLGNNAAAPADWINGNSLLFFPALIKHSNQRNAFGKLLPSNCPLIFNRASLGLAPTIRSIMEFHGALSDLRSDPSGLDTAVPSLRSCFSYPDMARGQ
jgi:hypothetical protein